MTDHRVRPVLRRVRPCTAWFAAPLVVLVAGCSSAVVGTPVEPGTTAPGTTAPETAGSSGSTSGPRQPDANLIILIVPNHGDQATATPATDPATDPGTDPAPTAMPPGAAETDFASAVAMILGGVEGLPTGALDSSAIYVGALDGRTQLSLELKGATPAQLALASRALVGKWSFALRPVLRGSVDAKACATLQATPEPDRLCDPESGEVLMLGADLGVRPSQVREATDQGAQAGSTLTFSAADARTIATYTAAHVGDRLAITDGRGLITAPTINSPIEGGAMQISGGYSTLRARALVGKLQLAAADVTISSNS